jgi:hypothetical protein
LCQFDSDDVNRAEIYWIAEGRRLGWPLLNLTDGGRVTHGWRCSDETRAKISVANTGRKRTPEQCKRVGDAHRGLKQSDETKAKRSQSLSGRPLSDSHVEALKATWYEKHTPETFEKMGAPKRGKPRDAATRAKLSVSLKGKPWSAARRASHRPREYS